MRKYLLRLSAISIIGVFFISSCEKDETIYQDYIIAGSITDGLIYHDYIPDDTLYDSQYKSDMSNVERDLDINHDGIPDFKFISNFSESPAHLRAMNRIIALNNNAIVTVIFRSDIIDTLMQGARIDANSNWGVSDCMLYYSSFIDYQDDVIEGLWKNVKNRYIGVRVVTDDNIFYGWIKVEMTSFYITIIKEFACTNGAHE